MKNKEKILDWLYFNILVPCLNIMGKFQIIIFILSILVGWKLGLELSKIISKLLVK